MIKHSAFNGNNWYFIKIFENLRSKILIKILENLGQKITFRCTTIFNCYFTVILT